MVLPQVKAVQFHPEAAIVKHLGKGVNNANASQFMSYKTAMPLFIMERIVALSLLFSICSISHKRICH
jgi:hypothetical protein